MFIYSTDSGVDGLAVLADVDERKSWPEEAAEDAKDSLRCEAASCDAMSMARKAGPAEGQSEDAENELKSWSSSSIFVVIRMAAAIFVVMLLLRLFSEASYVANGMSAGYGQLTSYKVDVDQNTLLSQRSLMPTRSSAKIGCAGAWIGV